MIATQPTSAAPTCPTCGAAALAGLGDGLSSCDRCRAVCVVDTLTRRWRPITNTYRGRVSKRIAGGKHDR